MTKSANLILQFFAVFLYVAAASIGAFTGGIWAGLGIAGALILWFGFWIADGGMPLTRRDVTLFTLAALALLAAELPLSVDLAISAKVWLQLATIFLPLLLLSSPRLQQGCASPHMIPAATLAMICGAVFLWVELQSGGVFLHHLKKPGAVLTEYNRGMAYLALLAFPIVAGLMLAGGRGAACVLVLLLLLPAGLTESHTAKLALIVGGAVAALAWAKPLWPRRGLQAASVAVVGWPFYARFAFGHFYDRVEAMHHSFMHRVEIWDYLSYRIGERPFFGWGLGTTHLLDFKNPHSQLYTAVQIPAPHAHNFMMSLWTECGAVGVLLGIAFLLLMLRLVVSLDARLRPYAYGCFAASVVVASFGFDVWTDSLWAAFALSGFLFGILQQNLQGDQHRPDIEIV